MVYRRKAGKQLLYIFKMKMTKVSSSRKEAKKKGTSLNFSELENKAVVALK